LLKRYDIGGIEGLRDRRRSGRPPDVSDEKILYIRTELSANPSGWRDGGLKLWRLSTRE